MIAKCIDERHVSRGYDPYNSADQLHILAQWNAKRFKEIAADAAMRRGFKKLFEPNYEFILGSDCASEFFASAHALAKGRLNPPI